MRSYLNDHYNYVDIVLIVLLLTTIFLRIYRDDIDDYFDQVRSPAVSRDLPPSHTFPCHRRLLRPGARGPRRLPRRLDASHLHLSLIHI